MTMFEDQNDIRLDSLKVQK